MERIKSTINLLTIMLHTSYDSSYLIDSETKKLNKKSIKLWLIIGVALIVVYLSNYIVGELKNIRAEELFLQFFFIVLQVLVIFESILLGTNIMYSEDIENYLHLPISNIRLFFTKFIVMMSIVFGTELTIVLPSLFIYGIKVIENKLLYVVLLILVLFLLSIFLSAACIIVMIPIMRLCRFIKNKYWYQSIVVLMMTGVMIIPIIIPTFNIQKTNLSEDIQDTSIYSENQEKNEDRQQLNIINDNIKQINKNFIVGNLGVQILLKSNTSSITNILKMLVMVIALLTVLFFIGKVTYINDVLWKLSLFDRKKNKKVNLSKKCKVRNNKISYMRNDIVDILKNPTFFMNYIYNVLIIVVSIMSLSIIIVPTLKEYAIQNLDAETIEELVFDFQIFSIILGIIQIICMISPISLTAISRYGKNAIFFKYIPIKQKTQFRLKNIPQLIINTIVVSIVLITISYLFPEINKLYVLGMFITATLLNIIYSYILLLIDLGRPQLNNESEISVIQQNDNKLFKYIVTSAICLVLWYIYRITRDLNLNIAIIIEIGILSLIIVILEIFINKKNNRLFEKIF